jgi:hypothetical protein
MMRGISVMISVFLRPMLSIKYPLKIQPSGVLADESEAVKKTVIFFTLLYVLHNF